MSFHLPWRTAYRGKRRHLVLPHYIEVRNDHCHLFYSFVFIVLLLVSLLGTARIYAVKACVNVAAIHLGGPQWGPLKWTRSSQQELGGHQQFWLCLTILLWLFSPCLTLSLNISFPREAFPNFPRPKCFLLFIFWATNCRGQTQCSRTWWEKQAPRPDFALQDTYCAEEPTSKKINIMVIKSCPGRNCCSESNRRATGGDGFSQRGLPNHYAFTPHT